MDSYDELFNKYNDALRTIELECYFKIRLKTGHWIKEAHLKPDFEAAKQDFGRSTGAGISIISMNNTLKPINCFRVHTSFTRMETVPLLIVLTHFCHML